ncbi:uncharacterized protein LOC128732868 [Sabethes cyaneus]|uniref:uncharacterized protein LOC128732868 n=1 Tax=Sabethes cyaneus TaxID=53552 RepID=UPI00237DBC29|nr:uncharacterized protein LOC128732868 [Sabethes cyaneus]
MNEIVAMCQRNDSYDETVEYLTDFSPEFADHDPSMENHSINEQQSNSEGSLQDNVADTFRDDYHDDSEQDNPEPELNMETAYKKKFFFLANFFVKQYTRQKKGVCINKKTNVPEKVFGDTIPEVLNCI